MRKIHVLAMLLLVVWIVFSLLASPGQAAAQKITPTPTQKPFVSHHGVADPNLFTVTQLRAAYDLQPLIDAGFDGMGQTIALVEEHTYAKTDVDSFVKRNHLPTPHIETVYVGAAAKTKPKATDIEATADVEVVLAIAPKATVLVYVTPNTFDEFAQIDVDGRAQVASVSLSVCEGIVPSAGYPLLHRVIIPVTQPHISVFVGSGDWGAFGCAEQIDPVTRRHVASGIAKMLSVSALASDPSVTAVGGTLLHLKKGKYSSEEVWNTSRSKGASGGGLSAYWPLPAYQQDYYLSDSNPDQMRQLPDVSASAENYGLIIGGRLVHVTGTSLSTPLWAAGTLLVNQYLTTKLNDPTALFVAPEMLYGLKTAYKNGKIRLAPFHEVTKGDNRSYLAGTGYNLATGLGTPDFFNLARDAAKIYDDLALDIEPTDTVGYVDRANDLYTQNRYDRALADYHLALALDPKNAAAYGGLGTVYEAQKQFKQALQAYLTYLQLTGNRADPKIVARIHALEAQ